MSDRAFRSVVAALFVCAVVLSSLLLGRIYREQEVEVGERVVELKKAAETYKQRLSSTEALLRGVSPYEGREAY